MRRAVEFGVHGRRPDGRGRCGARGMVVLVTNEPVESGMADIVLVPPPGPRRAHVGLPKTEFAVTSLAEPRVTELLVPHMPTFDVHPR